MLEYLVSLSYRTACWMFMKLGRDEVIMAPHMSFGFLANSAHGLIQGGAKIGQWGVASPKDFFRLEGFSDNRMYSIDLKEYGEKRCYFWFHSEIKNFDAFWRLFGLSRFAFFKCNFYRFLYGKVLHLQLFCVISMFVSGRSSPERMSEMLLS